MCNLQRWILRSKLIFIMTQKHKISVIHRSHNVKKLFGLQFFDGRIIDPVLRIRILIFWMLYTEQLHLFLSEKYSTYNLTNTSSNFCFDLLNGSFLVVVNFFPKFRFCFLQENHESPKFTWSATCHELSLCCNTFFSLTTVLTLSVNFSIKNHSNWKCSQLKEC